LKVVAVETVDDIKLFRLEVVASSLRVVVAVTVDNIIL
jgi:hypothetical protein